MLENIRKNLNQFSLFNRNPRINVEDLGQLQRGRRPSRQKSRKKKSPRAKKDNKFKQKLIKLFNKFRKRSKIELKPKIAVSANLTMINLPYPIELSQFHSILAMKTSKDFMVVQHYDGLSLIKHSRSMAKGEGRFLNDACYSEHADKYFVYDSRSKILKQKAIPSKFYTNKPATKALKFEGSEWFGRTIRALKGNSRWLVLSKNKKSLVVFDTKDRSSFAVEPDLPSHFYDHACLKDNRVLVLCSDLEMVELEVNTKSKSFLTLSRKKIPKCHTQREEQAMTLCSCAESKFLGVCTKSKQNFTLSRFFLYRVGARRGLTFQICLDLWNGFTCFFYALEMLRYENDKLVVVGMSHEQKSTLHRLVFDTRNKKVMGVDRVGTLTKKPMRLIRESGKLFGSDCGGNVFSIDFS